jgi:hypothetical protein
VPASVWLAGHRATGHLNVRCFHHG